MSKLTGSSVVCCAVAALLSLVSAPCAAQSAYSVLDLGRADVPRDTIPPPYSCFPDLCWDQMLMNGSGQLAISTNGARNPDVYYWEPGLAARILVDGHLDDFTRAVAISSNGIIVGTSDGGVTIPFTWSKSAGFKALCCADTYYPMAVNASGVVVGFQLFGAFRAVIWNKSSTPTYLDDLEIAGGAPWISFEQARSISDAGTISGIGRLTTSTGAVETHYFALTPTPAGPGSGALDRSDWTAAATEQASDDPPSQAIDGNIGTRFSTGRAQHDSQGFSVTWPGNRTIGRIRMDVGPSSNDYPRTCGIWVTDTSGNVTFVDCAADASGTVDVSFAPLPVNKIEVWQWGSASSWWSIAEFNVFKE